jgi:hypothetical protein
MRFFQIKKQGKRLAAQLAINSLTALPRTFSKSYRVHLRFGE